VSDWALLGVLFASEKWQASAPVALATLKAWPGGDDAYAFRTSAMSAGRQRIASTVTLRR
jgi:hypothetical protein